MIEAGLNKVTLEEKDVAFRATLNNWIIERLAYYKQNPFSEFEREEIEPITKQTIVFRNTEWVAATPEKIEQARKLLRENYEKIIGLLDEYVDMPKDEKILVALWVIGTYFHKEFETYPYLFFNAMRGSGKTRLLKLISHIAWNGLLLTSLKETTLFRTAGKHTLGIDEFEHVGKKEYENLRELLNASYKKGLKVIRFKKVKKHTKNDETGKDETSEDQEAEEFEPYTPIQMANIWGMDEVLGDRCITITLEKSDNPLITKRVEDFQENLFIKQIKNNFSLILVYECRYFSENHVYAKWNSYISDRYTTLTTLHTLDTLSTLSTPKELFLDEMFLKIDNSGISGRNLELWMPLFLIAEKIGEEVFLETLDIGRKYVNNKKVDEANESKDVQLYEFVSKQHSEDYVPLKSLTFLFRQFINQDDNEDLWLNSKWMVRALKRLKLITLKRRMPEGVEVLLDVEKAKEKLKMFK